MYFRINTLKIDEADVVKRLLSNIEFDKPQCFYKKFIYQTDAEIGKTFEHALGLVYVQSLSSMLPALVLNPNENEFVLDLCSAPGSKTTLMAELMNNKGLILANEISLERIKMLASNFDRMGMLNSTISNFDGTLLSKYFQDEFDKILIDPPCSALGSLQDTSKSMRERNLKRIKHLVEIQLKLLTSSAKMLKPGGEIVYSTCTTTFEENEYIIEKFTKKHPFEIIEITNQNIFESNYLGEKISKELSKTIRIESDKFNSEAFFIAKLKKIDGQQNKKIITKLNVPKKVFNEFDDAVIMSILSGLSEKYGIENIFWKDFLFHKKETDIYFIAKSSFDFSRIPFHRIGLKLASLDSKTGWRISINAAQILCKQISKNILTLENKRDLISYFMGQKTKVDHQNSDFVVVKFNGLMIGSGKVRDGILFSYFPKGRRMNEVDFSLLKE